MGREIGRVNVQTNELHPSDIEISNLGPGCYVRIVDGDKSYWTEIVKADGNRITAVVHPELGSSGPGCDKCLSSQSAVVYGKQNIVELGCDNYCWC